MDTHELTQINFEQLRLAYYESTRAPFAVAILEDSYRDRLSQGHGAFWDLSEIDFKHGSLGKALDDLFIYYSLIEVAALAGCMPMPLPSRFAEPALSILSDSSIREYYEDELHFLLPRLLRQRLEGSAIVVSGQSQDERASLFATFLGINASIENDLDIDVFISYLKGNSLGGYGLDDLANLTREPRPFFERLAKSQQDNPPDKLDSALQGFRSFLIFMHRTDAFLRACSAHPLLGSAFWNFHYRLFGGLRGEIEAFMGDVLNNFCSWSSKIETEDAASDIPVEPRILESLESIEEMRWATRRLTSNFYARPLQNLFADDSANSSYPENMLGLDALLDRSVDYLDLSVRSANALKNANIMNIRDLVSLNGEEVSKDVGNRSMKEISEVLDKLGLSMGMDVSRVSREESKDEEREKEGELPTLV